MAVGYVVVIRKIANMYAISPAAYGQRNESYNKLSLLCVYKSHGLY